jgi:hypothetical protein
MRLAALERPTGGLMKKLIVIAAMIAAFGLGGAAAFAASTDKPPSPPGQAECGHGNTEKPCKEDPQPDKGKDCEAHGNQGGVNEDHCKVDETTPTETTPTTPTETTPTTPTETTPTTTTETTTSTSTETTPTETTSAVTTATETTQAETTVANPEEQQVFTPPVQQNKGAQSAPVSQVEASGSAARPTTAAQPAPLTP